jgi:hypothetical protein
MLLHIVNRLIAVVLSLAVVVAAVLFAAEVVRWAVDSPPWIPWHGWGDTLLDVRAGDPAVLLASVAAVVAGLLLLLLELTPRRPHDLATAPLGDDVETVTTRRGLRSAAQTAARSISGVRSADVDVRRRSVRVTARTKGRGMKHEIGDSVRDAVAATLDDLELERTPKVRVSVQEES